MNCNNCGRGGEKYLRRKLCHMCYERQRRSGRIDPLVSAHSARQHIELLVTAGWHYGEMARAAEVNMSQIRTIRHGLEWINAKTAVAICGINIGDLQRSQRSGRCADPKARAAKTWATRRANKLAAQRIVEQQALLISTAAQHARQKVIMADRRREAERRREIAHSPGAATLIGMPTESWVDEAVCAQTDPDLFFPEKGGSTRQAKKVCLGCPVRQRCLDWAMRPEHEERFGIWGGKSERERSRMARNIA